MSVAVANIIQIALINIAMSGIFFGVYCNTNFIHFQPSQKHRKLLKRYIPYVPLLTFLANYLSLHF